MSQIIAYLLVYLLSIDSLFTQTFNNTNTSNKINILCREDHDCINDILNCDATNDQECQILCSGRWACSNSTINCGEAKRCEVLCTGQNSCLKFNLDDSTTINCGSSSNQDPDQNCVVVCGSESNVAACAEATINGNNQNLAIYAHGTQTLDSAKINCAKNRTCFVDCTTVGACNSASINGINSNKLDVMCDFRYSSCQGIQLYCPLNTIEDNQCILSGIGIEDNSDMDLYCIGSFNDIHIESELNINYTINRGRMFCTEYYNHSCVIGDNIQCVCPLEQTQEPTRNPGASPTNAPVMSTTGDKEEEEKESDKVSMIIGIIFACAVFSAFAAWVIWYFVFREPEPKYNGNTSNSKQGQKNKKKGGYQTIVAANNGKDMNSKGNKADDHHDDEKQSELANITDK